jgi:TolB protein
LSVSADGKFVVFDSNRSGKSEIWRVSADGNGLQQLTFDGGNSSPGVTADGKWLVYQHSAGDGNSVWRIALEGGEPIRLTDKNAEHPRISPDGKSVACGYSANGKTQLAIFSIEGGEPLKLFDVPTTFNFDNTAIRWSPDGRSINYRDWSNGIWSQSTTGGEPVRLENLPPEKFYTYGWSPDGKQFAFVRGQEIRDVVLMSNLR